MENKVLVDGYTFFVTDSEGEVNGTGGFYHRDTRHLSALDVSVSDAELRYIGEHTRTPSHRLIRYSLTTGGDVDATGPSHDADIVVSRDQKVGKGVFVERLTLHNHSPSQRTESLEVGFGVDFADIFEVRGIDTGIERSIRTCVEEGTVHHTYSYDYGSFSTSVEFDEPAETLEEEGAVFRFELGPQESESVTLRIEADDGEGRRNEDSKEEGEKDRSEFRREPSSEIPRGITTGNADYDRVFRQAAADIEALTVLSEHGRVPLAGVPWFATAFGRDALIAAYQTLHADPGLARGTLRYLASYQGEEHDETTEEEPGKIFHEVRHGELADLGFVPHTPYYGTVDATPLWVVLLHETYDWTRDEALVDELRDSLLGALGWIEKAVDEGDDPFVYYTSGVLPHKAWKDTSESVRFADGEVAETPIASAEVQGYAYDALTRAADLLRDTGDEERAERCAERAASLKQRFDEEFWLQERGFYVAAIADNGVVDSVTSNVGQCLWSGIVDEGRADDVRDRLLEPDMFSGWGIRTMSASDAGYSPVSYHTGSVWPHDTSLVALGLAGYGYHDAAEEVADAVLEAATRFDGHSVPELFCGFDDETPPHTYSAACVPQAWGAGAPYALLRALFDLTPSEEGGVEVGLYPDCVDTSAVEPVLERWE